tara:strand:- start:2125 stop:2778 length:654 start_codon:yes stop_codon:yes gene_type:complete
MGYLDSTTVTVDAVLTKQGRKLLAQGQALNIDYFELTDTGIDYRLWNTGHPSGSAHYGEAIENLPQLEATVNAAYFMRNKLVTLNKDTTALPVIQALQDYNFGAVHAPMGFIPNLMNHPEPEGFHLIIPDTTVVSVTNAQAVDMSGNALTFLSEQDIPNAAMYKGFEFIINPQTVSSNKTLAVTFVSITSGAYKTITLTVEKNDQVTSGQSTQNPVG